MNRQDKFMNDIFGDGGDKQSGKVEQSLRALRAQRTTAANS